MVDQLFHILFHGFAFGGANFRSCNYRPGILAQPLYTLFDDVVALPHLFHAHQIPVVAVTLDTNGDVEVQPVIDRLRLLPAQIPHHSRAAQHRAGKTQRHRAFRRHHADAHRALLENTVVGQQRFLLVHMSGETVGKVVQII